MSSARAGVILVLAAFIGLLIAPAAVGAVGTPVSDSASNDSESGITVSSFMQSSAADAESSIESSLFETAYESADNESRADAVVDRTNALQERVTALETEREELRENEESLSSAEYRARMTQLTVEIAMLDRSLDRIVPRATEAGVDRERLGVLRENASDLNGPKVETAARGLAGFDERPGNGPPDSAPATRESPRENGTEPGSGGSTPSPADRNTSAAGNSEPSPGSASDSPGSADGHAIAEAKGKTNTSEQKIGTDGGDEDSEVRDRSAGRTPSSGSSGQSATDRAGGTEPAGEPDRGPPDDAPDR